jgi:hypothetical protein
MRSLERGAKLNRDLATKEIITDENATSTRKEAIDKVRIAEENKHKPN